ncbi:MAG: ABC transporter family substrate-binding protein [Nitriliruptoraceae bacterium]|nr:ABC transporter family substrate-binding protein [Nitriliruptoraceae bacterium]
MRMRRRSVKMTAIAAAAALVLSACGNGDDGETDDTVDDEDVETDDDTDDDDTDDEPSADGPADTTVVYAAEQEFASYNAGTADQNATRNTLVLNGVLEGFWRFAPDGFAEANTDFGTYELTSEDPQIVTYTINDEVTWSDGEPIDCADMLLTWAANAGVYTTGEEDEDGNETPLFSTAGTAGYEDWAKPSCADGDKTLEVEYENVYASWEAINPVTMPAHIVAEQGGLTVAEFIEAIENDDADALADAAAFYNSGWVMNPGELLDAALMPSSGPYTITDWQAGESLTLEYNENYWGEAPATRTIVFRFLDQDQQAQALDNREVDIIDPQPNPDLLNQLDGMQGVVVETGESFIYEHLDFNMSSGSPFEDRDLREAFALCVPRQLIIDNLIAPQNPDAEVLDARLTYSFQPDYAEQVAGTIAGDYADVDIEQSAALLAEAGMEGMEVAIGYQAPNPRRTNIVELIRDSCGEAGFEIVDQGSDTFFGGELDETDFDVALFAWVGSGYVSGTASTFTTPSACAAGQKGNNNGCYSSEVVDDLYRQLLAELDPDAARDLVAQIEAQLWEDLPTIPLFTFPSVIAFADDIDGVVNNQTQGGITWNMEEWARQ